MADRKAARKRSRPATGNRRRYEVLLPLRFNDGREVPDGWLADAVREIVDRFGAESSETRGVEGVWRKGGVTYRDDLVRLVVDAPNTDASREWMRAFKTRWAARLEQLDLRVVSFLIRVL